MIDSDSRCILAISGSAVTTGERPRLFSAKDTVPAAAHNEPVSFPISTPEYRRRSETAKCLLSSVLSLISPPRILRASFTISISEFRSFVCFSRPAFWIFEFAAAVAESRAVDPEKYAEYTEASAASAAAANVHLSPTKILPLKGFHYLNLLTKGFEFSQVAAERSTTRTGRKGKTCRRVASQMG